MHFVWDFKIFKNYNIKPSKLADICSETFKMIAKKKSALNLDNNTDKCFVSIHNYSTKIKFHGEDGKTIIFSVPE